MKRTIITITGFQTGRVYYTIGHNDYCAMAKNYKEFKKYFPDTRLTMANEYGEAMTPAEFNEFIAF